MIQKLCIIARLIPPAFTGAGLRIYRQACHFADRGIDTTIITMVENHDLLDNLAIKTIKSSPKLNEKGNLLLKMLYVPVIFIQMIKLIQKEFDVVHCVLGQTDYFSIIAQVVCLLKGIKYTTGSTLDGVDDPVTAKRSFLGGLRIYLLSRSKACFCISPLLRQRFHEIGFNMNKVNLVPNGVNTKKFYIRNESEKAALKKRLNISPYEKVFMSIGAVHKRKGFLEIIQELKKLKGRSGNFIYIVIGPKEYDTESVQYFSEIKEFIEENRLEERVRFVGRQDDISDWLAIADLFLFNSESEGFGTVVIEAQACGVPVITTRIQSISDYVIKSRENGVIINHISEMASEIEKLLGDNNYYTKVSAGGRENAVNRFSDKSIIDQYLHYFNSVC